MTLSSYRRGACHAGASQHVVENACLRKPACSVPVNSTRNTCVQLYMMSVIVICP